MGILPNFAKQNLESGKTDGIRNSHARAGEMAQRLRALNALPKDPDPIPSTHMVAHNPPSSGLQGHWRYLDIIAGKAPIHIVKKIKKILCTQRLLVCFPVTQT